MLGATCFRYTSIIVKLFFYIDEAFLDILKSKVLLANPLNDII